VLLLQRAQAASASGVSIGPFASASGVSIGPFVPVKQVN
jgi:hypothetical protein